MTKEEAEIIMPLIRQLEKYNTCRCDTGWQRDDDHRGPCCEYLYNDKLIADARELRIES